METSEHLVEVLLSGSALLLISICIFLISRKIKSIPFPLMLFGIGLFLSISAPGIFHAIKLTPSVVLYIYLPILLFESAYSFDFKEFKKILIPGFIFATIGLLISASVIGVTLHVLFQIPLFESLLYASVISSTDPIAVLSIFKSLGIPKRLQLLIDGESFLNDATSVVFFKIFSSILGIGVLTTTDTTFTHTDVLLQLGQFCYLIIGGAVLGVLLGWFFSEIISFIINIPIVEATLTIVLASLVFIVAEHFFHVSGIMAVLFAGLVVGNYGKAKFSPMAQHTMHGTWELLGFIVTSIVFILIGYEMDLSFLSSSLILVIAATLALLVGRFLSIFITGFLYNICVSEPKRLPMAWLQLANIGGVRGVLPLIVILSLPVEFQYRALFIQLVLAAILFTLVINTLLIEPFIKFLHLNKPTESQIIETKLTEIVLIQNMLYKLEKLQDMEEVSPSICELHKEELLNKIEVLQKELLLFVTSYTHINLKEEFEKILKRYFIHVEKSAYHDLYRKQIIDIVLYEQLISSLNKQLSNIEKSNTQFSKSRTNIELKLQKLKKVNISLKSLSKKIIGTSEEQSIKSIYLYYKARIVGDEKVIEEMDHFYNRNIHLLSNLELTHLKETYIELLAYNKNVIKKLKVKYKDIANEIEEQIYTKEFLAFKDDLLQEFKDEDRISEKALKDIII